jgi:predicted AlkP superfamily pyrophosphatase or phosphodiesterase
MASALLAYTAQSDRGVPPLNALHLTDFDHEQHVNGVFSDVAKKSLEMEDALLGRYLAAIDGAVGLEKANVLVVSDHGFNNQTYLVSPGGMLRLLAASNDSLVGVARAVGW